MSSAIMKSHGQIFMYTDIFTSLGYILSTGIVGNSVFILLKDFQTIFQSNCPILHSPPTSAMYVNLKHFFKEREMMMLPIIDKIFLMEHYI